MKIAVARETRPGEARVAMVPDLVDKLTRLGWSVAVETGAGELSQYFDDEYLAAGAEVTEDPYADAGLVDPVNPPDRSVVRRVPEGTATM